LIADHSFRWGDPFHPSTITSRSCSMGANLTTVDGHIEAIKRWREAYNSAC
jgi:hypothetical protein